eukprot:Gregarina_sp_Poly_1__4369@NODE_2363_length_2231_cov_400_485213_g1505_i0_p2_GENE_NODE_2363_length_2231_cov_400_485213_g1505_i0NODE_2363_length_2231_cov_400_485213_g1505_i0_p2_ORF_typecomplete_len208_score30_40Chromo/PF00385_24/1_2e10Chromo/PF00385_24/8_7e03Chromo_shadow/PF01393_19/3_3e02Chromo_shadow/PF01393_19/0_037Trypan_PARP/PF05887_11/0_078Paramyx_P_V_C/PF03210_13/0_089DUF2066/PF09839_9/0_12Mtf2_C/PF14061_6/0_26_NODE_2363_length_2231_cov_400_485213_g1505_i093716
MTTSTGKSVTVEDDIYEMEDVLAYRVQDNQEQWLVKWKGYDDPADQTWEPRTNLLNPGTALTNKMEQCKKEFLDKKIGSGGAGSRKRGAATTGVTSKESKPESRRKARKTVEEEPLAQPEPKKASPKVKPAPSMAPQEEKALGPHGEVVVSHIGKGQGGAVREYAVTLKWSNGFEQVLNVSEVRAKYSAQLLDYLLSRVRFRDERHH